MGPVSSSTRLRLVGRLYRPFETSLNCSPFNLISKLRLCLDEGEWISDMWSHTDAHILFLQTFMADLQPLPSDSAGSPCPPILGEHMRRLIDVKGDIVHIIWVAVKNMLEGF